MKNIKNSLSISETLKEAGIKNAHIVLEDLIIHWLALCRYEQIDTFKEGIKLGLAFGLLLDESTEDY